MRGHTDIPKIGHKLVPGIFREDHDREMETNKVRLFQEMAPARHENVPLMIRETKRQG